MLPVCAELFYTPVGTAFADVLIKDTGRLGRSAARAFVPGCGVVTRSERISD
jgi:hypothetical protein